MQGDRERHQEVAGRGERGLWLHPGELGQAGPRAAEARVRQVLEALLQHAQGVLQGGTVSARKHHCKMTCEAPLEAIVFSLADSCKTDRARPFALLPIDVNRTSKMKRTRYIFLRSSLFWKDEVLLPSNSVIDMELQELSTKSGEQQASMHTQAFMTQMGSSS